MKTTLFSLLLRPLNICLYISHFCTVLIDTYYLYLLILYITSYCPDWFLTKALPLRDSLRQPMIPKMDVMSWDGRIISIPLIFLFLSLPGIGKWGLGINATQPEFLCWHSGTICGDKKYRGFPVKPAIPNHAMFSRDGIKKRGCLQISWFFVQLCGVANLEPGVLSSPACCI
jgi:hypothetical protein